METGKASSKSGGVCLLNIKKGMFVHPLKAKLPISVTESGIITYEEIPLQSPKASLPIVVTEFGIVMDVKL
jgi:hypothetical protein